MKKPNFTTYHELSKKNGNRRIWLEGEPLIRAGFKPGDFFETVLNIDTLAVTFNHIADSKEARLRHKNKEIRKISRRNMGTWIKPIIDLCNANITEFFGEFCRFRSQASKGQITFAIHPLDLAQAKREKSYRKNIEKGFLTKGDAFLGLGISSAAFSAGFANEGIKTKQLWAVEMNAHYLNVACQNNPETYKDAHMFCGTVEEVEKDLLEPVDLFGFSMACTNHSPVGVTKKQIETAEDSEEATSLFGVVEMIKATNPAVLISENVVKAKDSASYKLLKLELTRLGYNFSEMVLDKSHSGALDRRTRYWMVIYSKGLDFNPESLFPETREPEHENFGEIMEEVSEPTAWHSLSKLTKREEVNKAEGRNFKVKLIDENTTIINTIPRNYTKHQVSNPHVVSKDGSSYRLITSNEHADMKLVPKKLVANCSATTAHEGLGQGISFLHGVGLAELIAKESLKNNNQKRLPL